MIVKSVPRNAIRQDMPKHDEKQIQQLLANRCANEERSAYSKK